MNRLQRNRESYINESCRPLFDSGAWIDDRGNIFIATYQPLIEEDLSGYTMVSPTHPSANPQAKRTVFKDRREKIWMEPVDLETGIRMVRDHILQNTRSKEANQVKTVFALLDKLSSEYVLDFKELSDLDIEAHRLRSERILRSAGIYPERLEAHAKRSMVQRVLRATGLDSLGRKNWLVMTQRLWAAERDGVRRNSSLERIDYKYSGILTAFLEAETSCRGVFASLSDRLKDDGSILKTVLFTKDNIKEVELKIQAQVIDKIIEVMIEQIDQAVLVKPYKSAGVRAIYKLTCVRIQLGRVKRLYEEGKPAEAVALWKNIRDSTKEYLQWARDEDIEKTLDKYPDNRRKDSELPVAA